MQVKFMPHDLAPPLAAAINLAVPACCRRAVIGRERQRILRANFNATAATDAAQPVQNKLFLGAIDLEGGGGALLGADGAIDAIVLRENQLAARAGDGLSRFKGILRGGRLAQ